MEWSVRLARQIKSVAIRNLVVPSSLEEISESVAGSSISSQLKDDQNGAGGGAIRPSTPPPPIIISSGQLVKNYICSADLPTTYIQVLGKPVGSSELQVYYTSVAAYETLNPSWLIDLEFKDLPPDLENLLYFRVLSGTPPLPLSLDDEDDSDDERGDKEATPSNQEKIVAEFQITVTHLWCLASNVKLSSLVYLPPNALLLATGDGGEGLLLPGPLYEALLAKGGSTVIPSLLAGAKLLDNEYLEDLEEFQSNTAAAALKEEEAKYKEKVESAMEALSLEDKERQGKNRQEEILRGEIKELEESLASQERLLQEEELAFGIEEQGLESEAKGIEDLMEKHAFLEGEITLAKAVIEKEKEDLLQKEFLLESRQMKLLGELQTIYPIQRSEHDYAIRGLELPADVLNSTRDDEHISSALGYVCHLVFMLSKYLQVPLRYIIEFRSSRSQIRDATQGDQAIFPLYRKGVERERFEWALSLLKKDVYQLLFARGMKINPEAHMLQNLQSLTLHESCPKLL